MIMLDLNTVDFTKGNGLVTVVTVDARTSEVLMVAHADREALEKTLESGEMHYRSRTRGLWHKGATSGNTQAVVSLTVDCDADAVLARVVPKGPACHNGTHSCFSDGAAFDALVSLDRTLLARAEALLTAPPSGSGQKPSYTQRLLGDRNLRLKKLGEEMAELVTACADGDQARAAEEGADVVYHVLVALRSVGVSLADVKEVLHLRAAPKPDMG